MLFLLERFYERVTSYFAKRPDVRLEVRVWDSEAGLTSDVKRTTGADWRTLNVPTGSLYVHDPAHPERPLAFVRNSHRVHSHLLHEAAHFFHDQLYDQAGPNWLDEGLAEALELHEWVDGELHLGVLPSTASLVALNEKYTESGWSLHGQLSGENESDDRLFWWAVVYYVGTHGLLPQFLEDLQSASPLQAWELRMGNLDESREEAFREFLVSLTKPEARTQIGIPGLRPVTIAGTGESQE